MKPVTVRLISDAICENPGVTPSDIASLLDFPLHRIVSTLHQLARNSIRFSEHDLGPVTPLTPVNAEAVVQLQMIRNATGLDVDALISRH